MMPIATFTIICGSRFTVRDSSRANGTAKWNSTRPAPTIRQLVCCRWRYQAISSGRLPAQVIRYCEKEKYAQSITKASSRFPRS